MIKCPFFKRINFKNKAVICEKILEDSLSVSNNFINKESLEEQLYNFCTCYSWKSCPIAQQIEMNYPLSR